MHDVGTDTKPHYGTDEFTDECANERADGYTHERSDDKVILDVRSSQQYEPSVQL